MGKEHLSRQFDADLDDIRMELLEMGGTVELMIDNSVRALVEWDSSLAKLVITTDFQICLDGCRINTSDRELKDGRMTKEQWAAMTPAQLMMWIIWAMPQGAESPFPEDQPAAGDFMG